MTKDQFLAQLTHRLGYLPYEEVKSRTDFYREAIDDRMEDGMTEEEAVAALGSLDDIVREIEESLPLSTIVKQRAKDSQEKLGNQGLWIALAVLGSPLWLPLLIALFVVILSINIVIWALIVSLIAVLISLGASGLVMAAGALVLPYPSAAPRLMLAGTGVTLIGVTLLLIPETGTLTKWLTQFGKLAVRGFKRLFLGRREAL